jgi:hypothetical protein
VSPDLSQTTHGFEEEDTFEGILFLRLKTGHLCPKYRVLNGARKHKFEIPEGLSETEYLLGDTVV